MNMMKLILIFAAVFTASRSFADPATPASNKHLKVVDSKDVEMVGIEYAKKHPRSFIMRDCPVIGNRDSGLYHLPGQPNYNQMLIINRCADKGKCLDNRQCFDTIEEAVATQVLACPLNANGTVKKCKKAEKVQRAYAPAMTKKI